MSAASASQLTVVSSHDYCCQFHRVSAARHVAHSAVEHGCRSVAFSAISTGIYGYPSLEAAPVAIKTVKEFLEGANGDKISLVVFVVFERKDFDAYSAFLP